MESDAASTELAMNGKRHLHRICRIASQKAYTWSERERLSDYSINNIDLSAGMKRGGEHGTKLERQDSMSLK